MEYLHHLQQRSKWQLKTNNSLKTSVMLLCDATIYGHYHHHHYHPGNDGLVSAVGVKTPAGEMRRIVTRF
jgi:hypothetical protein